MFRFKTRQLHSVFFILLFVSIVTFGMIGVTKPTSFGEGTIMPSMNDFSEGWVYQKDKTSMVVSFPASFDVQDGEKFSFMHRIPDMTNESLYLVFSTSKQPVKVFVDDREIYTSRKKNDGMNAYHVIQLKPEYSGKNIVLCYNRRPNKLLQVSGITIGNKAEFVGTLAKDKLLDCLVGGLSIIIGVLLFFVYGCIQNTTVAKRWLLYANVEGILFGLFSVLNGNAIALITGWNYGIAMLRFFIVVLFVIVHLMAVRLFLKKKRLLAWTDYGIVFWAIFFISVLILQFFHLVPFDGAYRISLWIGGLFVLIYTYILWICVYDYKEVEGKAFFFDNIILVAGMVLQVIMHFMGSDITGNHLILPGAFVLFLLFNWIQSLKRALRTQEEKYEPSYDEEKMRMSIVDRMNPNLLLASLKTLQNLIKKGSENSVKVLYYLSVYMTDNLKTIQQPDDIIDFSEELEHIMSYLQLQKNRNSNMKYALECKVTDFRIPRCSIEPFIEKAVKYGIGGRHNIGNVVLRTYMRAEGYAIQIIDDGVGYDIKSLKNTGMTSVLGLIALLEEKCNALTEVVSHPGKGTVITIILPMIENELIDETEDERIPF